MTKVMFRDELAFLSNFYEKSFYVPHFGVEVQTGEHAFNAFKTVAEDEREWVLNAATPQEAKTRGRQVTLRPGWDEKIRFKAMQVTLNNKFKDKELQEQLLATKALKLVETNTWHDQFWGDCICDKHKETPGNNHLGLYLMAVRTSLAIKRSNG